MAALDALQERYTAYLKTCVDCMIEGRRFDVPQTERQAFFPVCDSLSSQIVKNARAHAVEIVSGWAGSKYTSVLRSHIKQQLREGHLDKSMRASLCIIGKHGVNEPRAGVSQEALDLYWMYLLDEGVAGRRPTISARCGMRMSEMTCVLATSGKTKITRWWIAVSHLGRGKQHPAAALGQSLCRAARASQ